MVSLFGFMAETQNLLVSKLLSIALLPKEDTILSQQGY